MASSGRSAKVAGAKYERELVDALVKLGYTAERVYASGALGTYFKRKGKQVSQDLSEDVILRYDKDGINHKVLVEVKYRSKAFPKWLTQLDNPTRIANYVFFPGVDIPSYLSMAETITESKNYSVNMFDGLIGEAQVLALRFPKRNTANKTGWVIAIP